MSESLISDILFDGSEMRHLISHCRCGIFGGLGYSEEVGVSRRLPEQESLFKGS